MSILDPIVRDAIVRHGLLCDVIACDPELADTAAFCARYGFAIEDAANTILVASKRLEPVRYAVCVLLGTTRLDVNHAVADLMGTKKLSFADADTTRDVTGMTIGGVTAIGIDGHPVYVDAAVMERARVVMGGGNRSSKVLLDPHELVKLPSVRIVEGLARPVA